jgi:hypothetical protein
MVAVISAVIAVTANDAEVVVVDLPIRELEARWGITRNALKSRAAALGVELVRVSSTDTRWPGAFIDLADDLHQHLQQGGMAIKAGLARGAKYRAFTILNKALLAAKGSGR